MKKLSFFVLFVLFVLIAQAQDVQIDGVYYDLYPNELSAAVVNDGNRMDDNGSGYELTELVIPETITHEGVTYTVKYISDYAFNNTRALRSIVLSDSITKIGMRAFAKCDSLESIRIPKNVIMVGSYAFEASHALQQIDVDEANTLYSSVGGCLCNKEGTSLIFAPGGRDSVTVAEGIVDIERYAFSYCNLRYVELPNSLTTIEYYAFAYCNALESIVIPDGVTHIKANAFRESVLLRSVMVGSGIEEIGNYAFMGCEAMDTITIFATKPPVAEDLSLNADSCLLRVWKKSYSAYVGHKYWSKFANISTLNVLTLKLNDDEMGMVVGAGYYETGAEVTIEAISLDGYEFVEWSDGNIDNPRVVVLQDDVELEARFRVKEESVGVDAIAATNCCYVENRVLYVDNLGAEYSVYDMLGRIVYSGSAQRVRLLKGVYLIRMGESVIRVFVR